MQTGVKCFFLYPPVTDVQRFISAYDPRPSNSEPFKLSHQETFLMILSVEELDPRLKGTEENVLRETEMV